MIDRICEFVFGNQRKMEQNAACYSSPELRIQRRGMQRFGGFVYVSSWVSVGALIGSIVSKGVGSGLEVDVFLIAATSITYMAAEKGIEKTVDAINVVLRRREAMQAPGGSIQQV